MGWRIWMLNFELYPSNYFVAWKSNVSQVWSKASCQLNSKTPCKCFFPQRKVLREKLQCQGKHCQCHAFAHSCSITLHFYYFKDPKTYSHRLLMACQNLVFACESSATLWDYSAHTNPYSLKKKLPSVPSWNPEKNPHCNMGTGTVSHLVH